MALLRWCLTFTRDLFQLIGQRNLIVVTWEASTYHLVRLISALKFESVFAHSPVSEIRGAYFLIATKHTTHGLWLELPL